MPQKHRASIQVIADLINVLTPEVIELIETHCGSHRAACAQQSLKDARMFCRTTTDAEGALVFSGYAEIEEKRVEVSFLTPSDATKVEKDAAFLANLAKKMKLDYELTASMSGL